MSAEVAVKRRGRPKKVTVLEDVPSATLEGSTSSTESAETKTKRTRARKAVNTQPANIQPPNAGVEDIIETQSRASVTKVTRSKTRNQVPKRVNNVPTTKATSDSPLNEAVPIPSGAPEVDYQQQTKDINAREQAFNDLKQVVQTISDEIQPTPEEIERLRSSQQQSNPVPKHTSTSLGLQLQRLDHVLLDTESSLESRQVELVDLLIRSKRRKLIESVSSQISQHTEHRIATAALLNDMRLSKAAGEIISLATGIIDQRHQIQQARSSPSLTPPTRPNPTNHPVTQAPTSTTSQPTTQSKPNLAPSKPTPLAPIPKPIPIPPQTTPRLQPRAPNPPPKNPPHLQPYPTQSHNNTNYNTTPKRPTQMTYEELRKTPDFKRLSWSWTGLIVGIPVLIATSWVIYKDYRSRMTEREMKLHHARNRASASADTGAGDN